MSEDTKIITMKRVLDLMCQIVGEYGVDYVYEKIGLACWNWDAEKQCPSCLIGHVVSRLGASDQFLDTYQAVSAAALIGHFASTYDRTIEEGVKDILGTAQLAQDTLKPWGTALMKALTEHADILRNRVVVEEVPQ